MKPNNLFLGMCPKFWANVKTISQKVGYTDRSTKNILVPSIDKIREAFNKLNLSMEDIEDRNRNLTEFGENLLNYFEYRSYVLGSFVKCNLMNKDQAKSLFYKLFQNHKPNCPLPFNKQKGDKKDYAFLTCIVNMLIENNKGDYSCNYDPRELTTVTDNRKPLRTLSRRVDGAFPGIVDPVAIWEIKEYYYTTTFGSRVADGVYESLLDGMELKELEDAGHHKIHHTLIIDDYFTWWECGRSYLCRLIDMLHMGYIDEVIFGYEVVERLPELIQEWKEEFNRSKIG